MEELAWEQVALLQEGLRLLLTSWGSTVPALWSFLRENSQSLSQLAVIAFGAIGIPLLWIRTRAADRQARAANEQARVANVQAKTAEQGHITDRFTKAIEQLGSDKMAVRLGAIYALERLSKDSSEDHWTIMEVLTAYVRDNAPWPPKRAGGNPFVDLQARDWDGTTGLPGTAEGGDCRGKKIRPATDIQTILTVLGRRDEDVRRRDKQAGRQLDLKETDLRGASLHEAHLEGAYLLKAHLECAELHGAHLEDAKLHAAHLEGAIFWTTQLRGASLLLAHLEGAVLSQAQGITQNHLNQAFGNERTILPKGLSLTRPAHWLKPEASPTTPPPSQPPQPEPRPDLSR